MRDFLKYGFDSGERATMQRNCSTLLSRNVGMVARALAVAVFCTPMALAAEVHLSPHADVGKKFVPQDVDWDHPLYQTSFDDAAALKDWQLEGGQRMSVAGGKFVLESKDEGPPATNTNHLVCWLTKEIPADFLLEFSVRPRSRKDGLNIVFFNARGLHGEGIFDPKLRPRTGVFREYHSGDLKNYHISYFATSLEKGPRGDANLRKNPGFHMVAQGKDLVSPAPADAFQTIRLYKRGGTIRLTVDDIVSVAYDDDGKSYGPVWDNSGWIGLRQMGRTVRCEYDHLKICPLKTAPPARLLPHMKDLPADYQDRLRRCLTDMDERLEDSKGKQPVFWANAAICSFALGRHVDGLNKYFASDVFDLKTTKQKLETYGFRLFSTTFIRFYALYNRHTGVIQGLLSPAAEKKFEEYLWNNSVPCVKLSDAKRDPWDSKGGENGQVTNTVGTLLAAQFLKDLPEYANRKFKDGSTAGEQYDAWLAYMSRWLDARVKYGQFQEYGASYQEYTLNALLNLRDFAEDPVLRTKAEMFLDLAFASMAEETVCTQRGGPKNRSKGHDRTCKHYKLLFNAPGGAITDTEFMNNYVLATSNYYPPKPVVDLANDNRGRGNYSFARLAPARTVVGTMEAYREGEQRSPWRKFDRDNPFVLNGFATANYVLGSHTIDTTAEAENHREQRWEGIVFANDPMARIYIDGKNEEVQGKYISNALKSIQDRNVMVTVKWGPNIDKGVDPHLRITFFYSLAAVEEDGGWIFVKSGRAFAAVKVVEGGYKWNKPWAHGDKFRQQTSVSLLLTRSSPPSSSLSTTLAITTTTSRPSKRP